ncbi:unnamed protein product [Caenorhabditis sp. 36 PRJEB53466]|nr:unnamed protein product [Caenorhabditis sp. 36 PRJEB53466]
MVQQTSESVCDPSFDSMTELRKYLLQSSFLLVSLLMHFRFLFVIRSFYRKSSRLNSFYSLYLLECWLNTVSIVILILIDKPSTYITYLCPIFVDAFPSPSYLLNFYWITDYLQLAKCIVHAFISINRMTCVLFPLQYVFWWNRCLSYCILFTFLAPFAVLWTALISKAYIIQYLGGFGIGYDHVVPWARLSVLKGIAFFSIVVIILTTSSFTVVYLSKKTKKSAKGTEKNLCIATVVSAFKIIGFLAAQLFFVISPFSGTDSDTAYDCWLQINDFLYDLVLFL